MSQDCHIERQHCFFAFVRGNNEIRFCDRYRSMFIGSGSTAINEVSTGPAIYRLTVNADGTTFHATPVLYSSTPATLLPGRRERRAF